MSTKSLLILGYVWPEPNSSAAGSHMLSLIHYFLSQNYQVTFASPAARGEHKIDLTEIGVTEQEVALNCASFDEFIAELSPDMVLFDRFMLEEQFGWRVSKHCPKAIKILDTEDLHSLRDARHRAFKQGRAFSASDLNSDIAKREIAAIYRCDLSLIISDYEYDLLVNQFHVPEHILLHCPFMLAAGCSPSDVTPFSDRQHFISIGNFRHAPNWDAVLWLKQSIWPLIRKQLPKAELHVYGAYPPPKATQLDSPKQGFLVKGWAPDARQVMEQAKVCLAPLRFGAGIKGKLAEAMLCGTPNVTTNIGVEGMQLQQAWPGLVSDLTDGQYSQQAQAIANQAVRLYQDQAFWETCQQQGFTLLEQNFNRDTIQSNLTIKLTSIANDLEAHRQANFTGLILQHHHLKSTQYMAQWIEAKNR